jgi:hypothetical protein
MEVLSFASLDSSLEVIASKIKYVRLMVYVFLATWLHI